MNVRNPLEANDWDIAAFLKLIASLQLSVWLLLALDASGLYVPIVQELFVLIYLLFVPGVILLRVFKLHNLNPIEGLLYTVGLSVTTVMLTGLFMNTVYSLFMPRPISLLPFIVTMSAVVAVLCLLCYRRDRAFSRPTVIDTHALSSPVALGLCLLPFMSIFATYWYNISGTSVGIIVTLFAVAGLILVCGLTTWVPRRYYGLVVLVAAIALLLYNSLITNYIWGLDIQSEYTAAQLVISNGFWGAPPLLTQASMDVNSVLSVTMFAPLVSIATGMSLTYVFKLIFPLLFALVPLGLYRLWQKQTSHRIALFGVFYFMVTFSFYTEMLSMARQELAELFLVLLLLLIVDRKMDRTPRVALFGLFGLSLIVSHYALTYVFLFCLVLALFVVAFTKHYDLSALTERLRTRGKERITRPFRRSRPLARNVSLNALLVLGLVATALLWYRFANNPEPFDNLIAILSLTLTSIGRAPILQPSVGPPSVAPSGVSHSVASSLVPATTSGAQSGLQQLLVSQPPLHELTEYLILITLIISVLGIAFAYKERRRLGLTSEYVGLAGASVVLLLLCAFVPYFAANLTLSRFFQISQIFLSVFFVIGFAGIVRVLDARYRKVSARGRGPLRFKAFAVFTVFLFVFNCGLVYKAAGELTDSPTVMALDSTLDYVKFSDQEMVAGQWLGGVKSGAHIYADAFTGFPASQDGGNVTGLPAGGGYWWML
ncbi:MAG: DUF2206 domain-containing protein, partial [Halobacteriota archaeon]